MDDDEAYEGQRRTAYHEAGHAIAAIKTPHGSVKYIDICDRNVDDESGGTFASSPDADDAFRIYAGPWAEEKFNNPDEAIDRDGVLGCLRTNEDDWTDFQHALGNDVSPTAWTQMQEAALGIGTAPREYRPSSAWHDKATSVLVKAWDDGDIQQLAEQMMARRKEIQLPNGQSIVREDTRDRWNAKDYCEAPRDGSGLVGPPPPIDQTTP